jgi:hypothetical protein
LQILACQLATTKRRRSISGIGEVNKTPHTQNNFANFIDFYSSSKPKNCKREII